MSSALLGFVFKNIKSSIVDSNNDDQNVQRGHLSSKTSEIIYLYVNFANMSPIFRIQEKWFLEALSDIIPSCVHLHAVNMF